VSDIVASEVHMELLEIVVFDEADRQDSEHISTGHTILKATPEALGDGLPTRMLGGLMFGVSGGPNVLKFALKFRSIESRRMSNW